MVSQSSLLILLIDLLRFWIPSDQLVVSPFVLVHPSKEDIKEVDQGFLLYWKHLLMSLQTSDYFVGDIDDIGRFVGFPEAVLVLFVHIKFNIVYKAIDYFLLFSACFDYLQEIACHILARLMPYAQLHLLIVVYCFVKKCLLELFCAIVVENRLVIFSGLGYQSYTEVGNRGLPLALSVLGLMRLPGGYMEKCLHFHHVSA